MGLEKEEQAFEVVVETVVEVAHLSLAQLALWRALKRPPPQ